ncbi:cell surface glycoprotein 1-like [Plectropomus leopardus]|uniref:cell surface glycoprotein 1-like n=1 Tax=Plectropomus leopardus TaxID=160734 RepID=UPI001C4B8DA7|nr:cell surface glycoprotein 1-like [Plectropomus leopardus]
MASEEDGTLLYLIFQHLKVNGYHKAAKVLEKHVAQVETPEESSSLHDIYTGWMKLCSLAQHAKQETEDSTSLKKSSIKPEPATSEEEEGADTKLTTDENNVDAKPPPESTTDGVESSNADLPCEERDADTVTEQLLHPAGETKTTNSDGEKKEEKTEEEETKPKQESAPVEASAEASNKAESSSSNSSDSEEEVEPSPVEPRQAASDQAEDQLRASDPAVTSSLDSESSKDHKEDDDELKQTPSTTEPATSDLTALETNDQPAESEAPPPADPDSENPEEEEVKNEEEKSKMTDGSDVTSPLKPEDQTATSATPEDPITDTEKAEEPADSISLNIQVEESDATEQETSQLLPEEAAESCKDDKTPKKKKKKSKKETPAKGETPTTDTPSTDSSTVDTSSDPALSTKSAKKRKRDKKRVEEVAEEEEVQKIEEEKQETETPLRFPQPKRKIVPEGNSA